MYLDPRIVEEQTDILAQYLRDDPLWESKNIEGSNLRKVLIGLASQFIRFRDKVNEIYDEYDPTITTNLIEEWETVVGIPDGCIGNKGTLAQRRVNILLKLAGVNVTTAKQFETVATILGLTIRVDTGIDASTLPLSLPFVLMSAAEAPFIIVVTVDESLKPQGLPLTLPFTLTSSTPNLLNCLFQKLKPANTKLIFRYGVV